jgi:hypothetical protein
VQPRRGQQPRVEQSLYLLLSCYGLLLSLPWRSSPAGTPCTDAFLLAGLLALPRCTARLLSATLVSACVRTRVSIRRFGSPALLSSLSSLLLPSLLLSLQESLSALCASTHTRCSCVATICWRFVAIWQSLHVVVPLLLLSLALALLLVLLLLLLLLLACCVAVAGLLRIFSLLALRSYSQNLVVP